MGRRLRPVSQEEKDAMCKMFLDGERCYAIAKAVHRHCELVRDTLKAELGYDYVNGIIKKRQTESRHITHQKTAAINAKSKKRKERAEAFRKERESVIYVTVQDGTQESIRVSKMKRYSELKAEGVNVYKRVDEQGFLNFAIALAKMFNFDKHRKEVAR